MQALVIMLTAWTGRTTKGLKNIIIKALLCYQYQSSSRWTAVPHSTQFHYVAPIISTRAIPSRPFPRRSSQRLLDESSYLSAYGSTNRCGCGCGGQPKNQWGEDSASSRGYRASDGGIRGAPLPQRRLQRLWHDVGNARHGRDVGGQCRAAKIYPLSIIDLLLEGVTGRDRD
jgi:hypothetical protein